MAEILGRSEYEWEETTWDQLMVGNFYRDTGGVLHRKALLVVDHKPIFFAVVCEPDGPTLGSVAYRPYPESKVWRCIGSKPKASEMNVPVSLPYSGTEVFGG